MIITRFTVAFLIGAVYLSGCEPQEPPREDQPITLEATEAASKVDYSGLEAVLKAAISPDGEILPKKLIATAKTLEEQLMLMTLAGPKTRADLFENEHSKLNYWYNARAAWSLRLMLTFSRERPKTDEKKTSEPVRWRITDDGVSIEEFAKRSFPIDGRSMTLASMDSLIVEEFGFKAVIGAPCVSPLRASIPTKPFNATVAERLIDERFNGFLDSEKRFVIDVASKQILVHPVLGQFEKRLIADHQEKYGVTGANLTTALLPHVRLSPHRRLQDAVGYKCVEAREPKVPLIVKREDD